MSMLILCLALFVTVLAMTGGLLAAGMRTGDRIGETQISRVEMDPIEHAIRFTLENPGDQGVLVGASVRPRSLRLRLESGSYVSVPRMTASSDWLAGRHAVIAAVAAGERTPVVVPVPPGIERRAELVVAVGEQRRLKVIHRAVEIADRRPSAHAEGSRRRASWPKVVEKAPRGLGARPSVGREPCE
jgi:hypothetical protein